MIALHHTSRLKRQQHPKVTWLSGLPKIQTKILPTVLEHNMEKDAVKLQ